MYTKAEINFFFFLVFLLLSPLLPQNQGVLPDRKKNHKHKYILDIIKMNEKKKSSQLHI